MFNTERIFIRNNIRAISEHSLNVSFSSNNSFYENLTFKTRRDIIFLIKSGYNKKTIIKLYILLKPSNFNEAVHYLTKENGIYQHIFFNSPNKDDICDICGEKKNMHINEIDITNNISFNNMDILKRTKKINILRIKKKEENSYKCKICEEDITDKEVHHKCVQCDNYFCYECLYLYIKDLIKNGKYALFCPECKNIYTKNTIEQIFLLSKDKDKEINNLKKLLEKNNSKEIILSNPDLMFCPIVDCEGYAKKNGKNDYNICNMGHKFCILCGELWHENGKCKEEESVDKLFEEYYKIYNLKKCPYCHIIVAKRGGCNHMNCQYCGKHWCWICNEIFVSVEEHYGNINSKCFNKMMNNNENNPINICSKCDIEINDDNYRAFNCGHIICYNCFIDHLLKNDVMILFPSKIINCIIIGCNDIKLISGDWFTKFVNETNNENLIKKYKNSLLFYEYALRPIFSLLAYMDILFTIFEFVVDLFYCCKKYKIIYVILEIIGILLFFIFIPIYIIIPLYPQFIIKKQYYSKLLPEFKTKYKNKLISFFVILGEEILSIVLLFPLAIIHYIFFIIVIPIFYLVLLIRNKIYNLDSW